MTQTNAKKEVTLEIDVLSYGPYGIGRLNGKAVMVPQTAPGDTIAARIVASKERYAIGEALRLIKPSPLRQAPPCPYVKDCGGCPWQHIMYEEQLRAKERSVENALRRIGKLDGFELRPIISSPREYHYRRRIRLHVDSARRLGFFGPSSHKLVEIDFCLIASEAVSNPVLRLRRWIRQLATPIEYLEIVTGDDPHQIVIVVKAAAKFIPRDQSLCERLAGQDTGINGVVFCGGDWRKVWGQASITVRLENDLSLMVDGDVFTQVNPDGNRLILDELLNAANFQSQDRVLELYCGAGNFTHSVAKRANEIVAIDDYRPSIENGKLNAQRNGLDNIRWVCAPVPAALARLKQRGEPFSKIILDPPRAGAKGIERDLTSLRAEKILYVSCNPATLARDLAALAKNGYQLQMVQPIDLFPHTFHVESLAVMML